MRGSGQWNVMQGRYPRNQRRSVDRDLDRGGCHSIRRESEAGYAQRFSLGKNSFMAARAVSASG